MIRYAALIAALLLTSYFASNYVMSLLIVIALHAIAAFGLSLLMGYMGQISLGQAGFYGLGAYGSALIAIHFGITPWISMLLAAVVSGAVAWSLGWLIFRLRGHHLAMATLGFGIVIHVGIVELHDLTGGPNGLAGVPPFNFFGTDLFLDWQIVPVAWAACLVALIACENLVKSPLGLSIRAIGANERVSASLGIDASRSKRWIFVISAALASIGGSIFGHYVGYLSPNPFSVAFSIKLLLMVAIGGFANIWGVLFGVIFVTIIGETLRPLGHYDMIIFGALLVAVIIFFPRGLLAGLQDMAVWIRNRLRTAKS